MTTKMKRLTRSVGEYTRGFASEDGKNYRIERQEMDPVISHVQFLDQKVNSAPKAGNRNDMRYIGSPPMTVLQDWLKKHNYKWDQYARNDEECADKFKAWFLTDPEMAAFRPFKKKASMIVVP